MAIDLHGKSVIITGGSKGIGRETARLFLRSGASVTITGRDQSAIDRALKDLDPESAQITGFRADVSAEEDCSRTVTHALNTFGRVDILINNAGMSARGKFCDSDAGLFTKLTGINFLGPVMMSRFCVDEIRKRRGQIVFVSTLAALKGMPGLSHYASSKMPLTAFAESIRGELKPDGVCVSLIYVGFTGNDSDKTIYDAKGNRVPMQRDRNSMTQEQVASCVLKAVRRRRSQMVLSAPGKAAALIFRLFPKLSEVILANRVLKSPMYKGHL